MHLSIPYAFTICLLALPLRSSAGQPGYDNGILAIPQADGPAQVGQFQDASFSLQPDGSWRLTDVKILNSGRLGKASVNAVEVVVSGTTPVSVFLRASGVISTCGFEDPVRVHQRKVGTRFEIGISTLWRTTVGVITCPAMLFPFKVTIPLDIYGLSAGTYAYDVNGIGGSFVLGSDNKFSDDCDTASMIAQGTCPYVP